MSNELQTITIAYQRGDYTFCEKLADSVNATPAVLEKLHELATTPTVNPNAVEILACIAANQSSPPDLLTKIALLPPDPKNAISEALADNPKCPPEILARLAQHSSKVVRAYVVQNKNALISTLATLANDPEEDVALTLVHRCNSSPEYAQITAMLARYPNEYVRTSLAERQTSHEETLSLLANDKAAGVRAAVAWQPHLPYEALLPLLVDSASTVRENAAKNERLNANFPIERNRAELKNALKTTGNDLDTALGLSTKGTSLRSSRPSPRAHEAPGLPAGPAARSATPIR